MITNFKIYENKNTPDIGDYVLCHINYVSDDTKELDRFVSENVGKITSYNTRYYFVTYNHFPFSEKHANPVPMERTEIDFFSKRKKDIEMLVDAKKYNL